MRNPATGELMNQLRWQPWTDPHVWQPYPTVFQLADAAGVHTAQVSSPTFQHTPLTKIALSGGTFHGRLSGEERMDLAAEQLAAGDRSLVYTYYSEVDGKGHRFGVDSDAWRGQLMYVDRLVQRLAEQLPPRTALYVTADHGMIDIPFDEESPHRLRRGLGAARRGRPAGRRGPRPPCLRGPGRRGRRARRAGARCSASSSGWPPGTRRSRRAGSGPRVDERVYGRIGDVVAAARDDVADHRLRAASRKESAMVGMHGSMTPVEQLVPLLEVRS